MRESVSKLLDKSEGSSAKWAQLLREVKSALAAAQRRVAEAEARSKRDIEGVMAKLRRAEEETQKAKAAEESARLLAERAQSMLSEFERTQSDNESRAAIALSRFSWANEHAEMAKRDRADAEAKAASAERAREEALAQAMAAREAAAETERKRDEDAAGHERMANELRLSMKKLEVDRTGEKHSFLLERRRLEGLLSEAKASARVLDIVPQRGDTGLLTGLDVQFGRDRFRVVPVRNAAGQIIEMKREEI